MVCETEEVKINPKVDDPRIFVDGTSRRDVVQVFSQINSFRFFDPA